jgi:hypothetical protein
MHPRLAELVDYAAAQRTALLVAVSTVPEPLRDERIQAGTWSVAEVLEHLHRVESGIARLLVRTIERRRQAGIPEEGDTGSLLNSLDAYDLTRRDGRLVAPDPVAPRGGYTAAHEARHAAQIAELGRTPTGPGPGTRSP